MNIEDLEEEFKSVSDSDQLTPYKWLPEFLEKSNTVALNFATLLGL